ncbi:MAG: septal ring lytic transglycosylase RlpA family protein [bacterium]|jgi:hypothetical protein
MVTISPKAKKAGCLIVLTMVLMSAVSAASGPALMVTTAVRTEGEEPSSEIIVNGVPVIRIRSGSEPYSYSERAEIIADRLRRLGGLAAICAPGIIGEAVVIKAGDELIVTVDAHTAALNNCNRAELALAWTDNVRSAFASSSRSERTTAVTRGGEREQTGIASWYGTGFHGRGTASGEAFDQNALTAAHRTLPFGTVVLVTSHVSGRRVLARINDRGPWTKGRIIDLSRAAAKEIGLTAQGVARVTIKVIE